MSRKAVEEFKGRAVIIMKKHCDSRYVAIGKTREMFLLKKKMLRDLTLKELGDEVLFSGTGYCPLCDHYYNRAIRPHKQCPLFDDYPSACCKEWRKMEDAREANNRRKFRYWFNKLYARIMVL